jgi:putative FmdB family regulatory protein
MPTYQYACTDAECGNRFELVQSFTDPAASECPVCHHGVRKVYGSVGVVFKGPGFYRTDSRASSSSSSSSSSDSAKSDAKSESKSDASSTPNADGAAKTDSKSSSKPAATGSSSSRAAASA